MIRLPALRCHPMTFIWIFALFSSKMNWETQNLIKSKFQDRHFGALRFGGLHIAVKYLICCVWHCAGVIYQADQLIQNLLIWDLNLLVLFLRIKFCQSFMQIKTRMDCEFCGFWDGSWHGPILGYQGSGGKTRKIGTAWWKLNGLIITNQMADGTSILASF